MHALARYAADDVTVAGSNLTTVLVVALIAVAAIGVALVLMRQVLAADEGTASMREIAGAVQEGAAAYLSRQFRTLGIFAVLAFFLLFLLPVYLSYCSCLSLVCS